jgi:hypothetical protein
MGLSFRGLTQPDPLQVGREAPTRTLMVCCVNMPKKRSMNTVDKEDLTMIQNRLNNRLRKRLGFKTPSEVFH